MRLIAKWYPQQEAIPDEGSFQDRKETLQALWGQSLQQLYERAAEGKSEGSKMIEVGRMCVKIAGRDAGLKCVVVEVIDDTFVKIDGQTRARKCNIRHLEPLAAKLDISKGISHEAVMKALKSQGVEPVEKNPARSGPKTGPRTEKPRKQTKTRNKSLEPKKAEKPKVAPKKAKN
jgi:large subunit ribosomal protein L14e